MRIAILKNNYFLSGGGSERYTNELIAQLQARGHQIHVLATRWDARAESTGVTLHRVPVIKWPSFVRVLSFALGARRLLENEPFDLVMSVERTIRQDICRAGGGCHSEWLRQLARYRPPWQSFLFRLNPLHPALLWIERRSFSPKNTRYIIANSHRGKEEIIRIYRFPADRIVLIHNGVDCQRFKPSLIRGDRKEFVLLFVGSGFVRKGLAFCIQALAKLPAHVRLLVAGSGKEGSYRRLAERARVAARVEFLGATSGMEEVYARGDLLVHPAIYEPFSNACLEAMACGLPVVTSRVNGASEIIVPGKNGAVVEDPGDINSLADAIRTFLDPNVHAAASIAARQTAESMPSSRNAEQTLELFQRLQA